MGGAGRGALHPRPHASTHLAKKDKSGLGKESPPRKGTATWEAEQRMLRPGPAWFPGDTLQEGPVPAWAGGGPKSRGPGSGQSLTEVGLTSILLQLISGTSSPANHLSGRERELGGWCLALSRWTGRGLPTLIQVVGGGASPREPSPRTRGSLGSGEVPHCHLHGASKREARRSQRSGQPWWEPVNGLVYSGSASQRREL